MPVDHHTAHLFFIPFTDLTVFHKIEKSDTGTSMDELLGNLISAAFGLVIDKTYKELLDMLQGLVTDIKWSTEDVIDLFHALLQRFNSRSTDRSQLVSWLLKMLHCIKMNLITPSWRHQEKTLIELVQDENLTDDNFKRYLSDDTEKQLDEIIDEIRQQRLDHIDNKLLDKVKDIVSSVLKDLESPNGALRQSGLKRHLLRICQAAVKTHFKPRVTQMVCWCIMALSKSGQLLQVGTGEGKSCIVAMFAAFRALRGEKVDIITSSPVLAERDFKDWQKFFEILKITVGCNTNKLGTDKSQCYQSQVVYGTIHDFAGDWLSQRVERMNIFAGRTFQCAIVDEVDSLTLDKGLQVVYISRDVPALQHLSPLLAFIWATVNQYTTVTDVMVGKKHSFLHVVRDTVKEANGFDELTILQMAEDTGMLEKGSVKDLGNNLSLLTEKTAGVTVNQLVEFFGTVEKRFPSCLFSLHCKTDDGLIKNLGKGTKLISKSVPLLLGTGGFCQYMYTSTDEMVMAVEAEIKESLNLTPCKLNKDSLTCNIPGFLASLVNAKLKIWIKNAIKAKAMTLGHEYMVEGHGIVPVDYSSTGVVENSMTLSNGLQQFLEMKHGYKLSDMTAISNYMSNVGLLRKYRGQLFGISGTLGQQAETETFREVYGIKTCHIPSFKRRKLFEIQGLIVDDETEWIKNICDAVTAQSQPTTYRDQRAVLVICETIRQATVLYDALEVLNKKLYISNNMDNSRIFEEIQAGDVIVATNLAGRGADLRVCNQVKTAGGLYVVQTFLPQNARVEAQAFGRTARQGSPGSAQLIVCSSHLPEPLKLVAALGKFLKQIKLFLTLFHRRDNSEILSTLLHILRNTCDSEIITVKNVRDSIAAKRLGRLSLYDIPNIMKKEELFNQYLQVLDEMYKICNNSPVKSDVSALNEFWGLWLLTEFDESKPGEDLRSKLTKDLEKAMQMLKKQESPTSNLHYYTALGNKLRKKGNLKESIQMYTKAIRQDQCWAAIAYYNRAFTSLSQQNRHQDPNTISQALEDLQKALDSAEFYSKEIEITQKYCEQVIHADEDFCPGSVLRFDTHIEARKKVLLLYKENIHVAMRKLERAEDLGRYVKVEEKVVYLLVPMTEFLPQLSVLTFRSANLILSKDLLKILQLITDPSFDTLNELKRFQSLGQTHIYTLDTQFSLGGILSRIHRSFFSP